MAGVTGSGGGDGVDDGTNDGSCGGSGGAVGPATVRCVTSVFGCSRVGVKWGGEANMDECFVARTWGGRNREGRWKKTKKRVEEKKEKKKLR